MIKRDILSFYLNYKCDHGYPHDALLKLSVIVC